MNDYIIYTLLSNGHYHTTPTAIFRSHLGALVFSLVVAPLRNPTFHQFSNNTLLQYTIIYPLSHLPPVPLTPSNGPWRGCKFLPFTPLLSMATLKTSNQSIYTSSVFHLLHSFICSIHSFMLIWSPNSTTRHGRYIFQGGR